MSKLTFSLIWFLHWLIYYIYGLITSFLPSKLYLVKYSILKLTTPFLKRQLFYFKPRHVIFFWINFTHQHDSRGGGNVAFATLTKYVATNVENRDSRLPEVLFWVWVRGSCNFWVLGPTEPNCTHLFPNFRSGRIALGLTIPPYSITIVEYWFGNGKIKFVCVWVFNILA